MKTILTIFLSVVTYSQAFNSAKPPASKELNTAIRKWKSDTNGCKNIRNNQLFDSIFDSITEKNIHNILDYLGNPDLQIDTFDSQNHYIIYEYYYHSFCKKK